MLCVRIDGREVETTPVSLARMVLDGRVDRCNPSRTSGGASEQSLEQSLGSSYCEALTGELLQRLRALCAPESSTVDMRKLRVRVEDLCQWRWANPHVAARFFWTAAWLNELMDRYDSAISFYDAFLQMSSGESRLRLLACNNRGVLRIRLGRLEGVEDLARAAIPDGGSKETLATSPPSEIGDSPSRGLPVACFNLLNLINVSLSVESLTQVVDEELAEFFLHLPEEERTWWLEPPSSEPQGSGGRGQVAPEPRAVVPEPCSERDLRILRAPTFRRLNTLTMRLAGEARRWPSDCGFRLADPARSANPQPAFMNPQSLLSLWECRPDGDGPQTPDSNRGAHLPSAVRHPPSASCAEAATLLLSNDIPSSLTRLESPLSRAERFAQEELADIEGRLALDHSEFARARLQGQRRILSSLNQGGRLAGLLARVDAQLERITQIENQKEQLEFQRACTRLISEVEQFCRLTDPCRAGREYQDLERRLQHLRAQPAPQAGRDTIGLLDELNARVERHMHRLNRVEIRKRIRGSLRQVRQNWPADWGMPVPESVYRALAQCHLNDPEGRIEDWSELKEQLDGHQGQYHLHRALAALRADDAGWEQVEDDLAKALSLKPDAWPAVAPLFGLPCSCSPADPQGESLTDAQNSLWAAANRLSDAMSQSANASGEDGDRGSVDQAGRLLQRAFQQMAPGSKRLGRLWQCVEATLWPLLERGDMGAIGRAEGLANKCLDYWLAGPSQVPGRGDPRHPVNLFLESCGQARRLVEAEQLLHAQPPRLEEAKRCYAGLVGAGLDRREQLKRAATGLYLAEFRQQDSPQVQRQVLTRLETWVDAVPEEARQQVQEQDIGREVERIRAALSAGRSLMVGGAQAKGPAGGGMKHAAAVDGCDDTTDGPGKDRGSSEKEK